MFRHLIAALCAALLFGQALPAAAYAGPAAPAPHAPAIAAEVAPSAAIGKASGAVAADLSAAVFTPAVHQVADRAGDVWKQRPGWSVHADGGRVQLAQLLLRGAGAGDVGGVGLGAHVRVLWFGDSTTAGVGAGSGGLTDINGARPNSTPMRAAAYLASLGFNVATDNVVSENNNGLTHALWNGYRPEISVGLNGTCASLSPAAAGAGLSSAGQSPQLGGVQPLMSNTLKGFCYTASAAADTIDYWFNAVAATGSMSVQINGAAVSGSPFSQTAGGTGVIRHGTPITGLSIAANDVVAINRVTSNIYFPFLLDIYNSSKKSFHIYNAGWRNSVIEDWLAAGTSGNPNSPQNAIANMSTFFDVMVIVEGINNQKIVPGTYTQAGTEANIKTFVNDALAGNPSLKLVFMTPNPINQGDGPSGSWSNAQMTSMYQDLANFYNGLTPGSAAFVDTNAVLCAHYAVSCPTSWSVLSGTKHLYDGGDSLHPNNGPGGSGVNGDGPGGNGDSIYNQMGIAAAKAIRTLLGV